MSKQIASETDLYQPIKALLRSQGFDVKGEVGAVDVVAVRGDEDPVIVELKTGFSLKLFHQAIARQSITDLVYIAVPRAAGRGFRTSLASNIKLSRRLGLGLITVRLKDAFVEIHVDPKPYKPRPSRKRKALLLKEFALRVGDPTEGGKTRKGLITAYRQDALKCLNILQGDGPLKASDVSQQAGTPRARQIMADNHYGWFERVDRGIYGITPKGVSALGDYADEIARLVPTPDPKQP